VLFCGDTLFAAGCGRLLGGTAEQLHHSLGRLATLPHNTLVYCAHEYTLANLQFAQTVEPNNIAIKQRIQSAQDLRTHRQATVPFTLKEDINSNPFLRTHLPDVKTAVKLHSKITKTMNDSETFAQLRRWKDHF
jgi:hydroxyacylglutathione hydrolase